MNRVSLILTMAGVTNALWDHFFEAPYLFPTSIFLAHEYCRFLSPPPHFQMKAETPKIRHQNKGKVQISVSNKNLASC